MKAGEVLRCQDCGKEFVRRSEHGLTPTRCPDCKLEARRQATRESNKRKRERRQRVLAAALEEKAKQARYCVVCGMEIPAVGRKKYCSQCAYKVGRQAHAVRQREERAADKRKDERLTVADVMESIAKRRREERQRHIEAVAAAKIFDKLADAADAAGMSYGKYQAMLRRQKEQHEKMAERGGIPGHDSSTGIK